MAGDALVMEVKFDYVFFGMEFNCFTDQVVRNGVKMIFILNMVINIDLHSCNVSILIALFGKEFFPQKYRQPVPGFHAFLIEFLAHPLGE